MKNILVPTDFSGTAYQTLFYISRLMKHREARFQILAIVQHEPVIRKIQFMAFLSSPTGEKIYQGRDNPSYVI